MLGSPTDLEAGAGHGGDRRPPSDGEPAVSTGVDQRAAAQRLDAGDETLHGLIQTDAPIEPAWSGGPLVDATGAVIGITTDLAGDRDAGFGFATPIELVHRLADELLAYGKVAHGWLGIEGADLTRRQGRPARRARRRRGPPGAAGQPGRRSRARRRRRHHRGRAASAVRSSSDLVVALRAHKPGEVVVVGYWRERPDTTRPR